MREAESQKSESFKNIKSLQGHSKSVGCIAVLENGNFISGSDEGPLKSGIRKQVNALKLSRRIVALLDASQCYATAISSVVLMMER